MLETESGVELVVVLEMESVEWVVALVVMLELDSAVVLVVVRVGELALMKDEKLELMIMMAGYLDLMTAGYLNLAVSKAENLCSAVYSVPLI